jgi:hypothetical protein
MHRYLDTPIVLMAGAAPSGWRHLRRKGSFPRRKEYGMARLSDEEREEAREDWQEHREDMQEDRQDFVGDQLDEHDDDD